MPELGQLPSLYFVLVILLAAAAGAIVTGWNGFSEARIIGGVAILIAMATAARAYIDITKRSAKRQHAILQERLKESEDRLRQAQKMEAIGQLAGGIAHDFNNLITVIGCSASLLGDSIESGDPKQEDIGQIREAVDRAAALTRQLLAFSRRQILKPVTLDLNDAVVDIEKMLQRVLGNHIAVHTALDTRLGMILADLGQIEQVIMNLSVNARDAMPAGGALMFATANRTLRMPEPHRHGVIPPGDYVTLTVRDTGQGIPPSAIERIFEPFYTTKEQGKGTGLGLATVQGIVSQAGGHITVESELGSGTTFVLYFPRMRTLERSTTNSAETRITPEDPLSPAEKPRVLIVDDEDAIRDIAARVLQQAGFRVSCAKHGEEAMSILTHQRNVGEPIALVLSDMVMPMMNGRELVDAIMSEFPGTRVFCMSGYRQEELFRESLAHEHVTLVHKPFEVGELIGVIREALGNPGEPSAV